MKKVVKIVVAFIVIALGSCTTYARVETPTTNL